MTYSNDNNDSLPYVAEVEVSLTDAELQVLKNQYNSELPEPSEQTKFNYAWGLIRSGRRSEQQKGVTLLGGSY
jgi:fission 1 protein